MAEINATINFKKGLLHIHRSRRRRVASDYLKQAVARMTKSDPSIVKVSPSLNRIVTLNAIGRLSNIKVSISKGADKVEVKPFVVQQAAPATAAAGSATKKQEEKKSAAKEGKDAKAAVSKPDANAKKS